MYFMIEISVITKKILALSFLKGVGPATLRKVAAAPNFGSLPIEELATHFPVISKGLAEPAAWQKAQDDTEWQVDQANRFAARILSPLDAEYPLLLAATKDDPFLIFVRGELAKNPEKSVAIIGTRQPTTHGMLIAKRITQYFVEKEWSVVSGLAIGCDAIAHQAALDAGGHTVAVLAHGLHTTSPSRHRKLAEDILDAGGCILTEYRFGQSAQPQQFVKRDRTQAGLAQGVVMIQSDIKGGSLHASRAALDYGRWLAVPYPTVLDFDNDEPKVQANILLADGSVAERENLLRCSSSDLARLVILRGREDYPQLVDASQRNEVHVRHVQRPLV